MEIKKILPQVKENILLKNYTTFRIGGAAKYFLIVKNKEDLIDVLIAVKNLKIPFFVLGGGSNVLISDKGFNGLVVKIENNNLKIKDNTILAEAGIPLGKLMDIATKKNLAGLSWAAGIPGTLGGAIYGNAGAFNKSIKDIVREVEVLDLNNFEINKLKNKDCKFSYRSSLFKKKKNLIILSAKLALRKGKGNKIKNEVKECLIYKKTKHPWNYPSAGSVFKNPGIELGDEDKSSSSTFVPSAAWLIEKANLKGKKIGQAEISKKHANFIVNLGGAKEKDVKKLIELIKKTVKNKFKITLQEEIQFL